MTGAELAELSGGPALDPFRWQARALARFSRWCCLIGLSSLLAGCITLGLSHENDGGHKGKVVDAITGQALAKARIRGALPSYSDRVVRTKADGSFCFHLVGDPGGIVISAKGYAPLRISVLQFLRTSRIELQPETRQNSSIWDANDEKKGLLTPFEHKILKRN